MNSKSITQALERQKVLVSDGGWGTFLHKKGLKAGECPELWNLEREDEVLDIARRYIEAGSDILETNTFGGNSFKLSHFGLTDRLGEINRTGVELSRTAAGEDRWVMASVGPTGKILITGEVTEDDLYRAFAEQVKHLAAGGADAMMIETMSDAAEAALAVRAAKDNTSCEVICSFTFERTVHGDFRTMMGVAPGKAAEEAVAAGADIVGVNCGNGYEGLDMVVRELKQASGGKPVLIQANAGIPERIGGVEVFPAEPEELAGRVALWIESGANIIGG
ncbi:MAG: homocysteine S-methyltransferase family protein, partial [Spirochaetota bacterium]